MSLSSSIRKRHRASLIATSAIAVVAATVLAPLASAAPQPMSGGDDSKGTAAVVASPSPTPTPSPAATTAAAATPTPAATGAPTTPAVAQKACDPKAPWRLSAQRDAEDPTTFTVTWADAACATRYNVSVFVDGKDDVTVVDGATTSFTAHGTNPAKTYQIQVGSRNDAGKGGTSPVFYLRPSIPGGVTGMKIDFSDVSSATLLWTAPTDRLPISYQLLVTRVADHKVIVDEKLDGAETKAALPGLDARGIFTISLQPTNKAGVGPMSRLVIGEEKPNPVKSIAAIRDPGNPKQIIVSWLPSDNTMRGAVLGYEIGYGKHSADQRVVVKQTDGKVTIPADESTVVIVRVITDRGHSRWSKAVRVPVDGNRLTTTTNPSIDLVEQDGVVTVAETNAIASSRLVISIAPTVANDGFTDTQYSQVGANFLSFRTVPKGSYVVTVSAAGKELARRYLNIGNVGFMAPTDWKVVRGFATISDGSVDMSKSGETQVLSLRPRTNQDVIMETDAQLTTGDGYGFWFRTSGLDAAKPTGLTFQYDPTYKKSFIIRQWQNGAECSAPIAVTPFPSSLDINGTHRIVMAAEGDTLFATLDGVQLFALPSIKQAVAGNQCKYAAPTGTQVGLRKWTNSQVVFKNTSIL